ncbi:MAG: transglycosylase domain-containing protein [Patescibacteria group bacterium]|jgi:1A family penicillin-binding protein
MAARTEQRSTLKEKSILEWIVYILQIIGRFTYKSIFYALKFIYITAGSFVSTLKTPFSYTRSTLPPYKKGYKKTARKKSRRSFQLYGIIKRVLFFCNFLVQRILNFLRFNRLKDIVKNFSKQFYLFYFFLVSLKERSNHSFIKRIHISVTRITGKLSKKKKVTRFGLFVRYTFLLLSITAFSITAFVYYTILRDLPNPNELISRNQVLTTKIYARDGSLLFKIYRNQNRSLVKLEDIPAHLVNATVAAEDKEFWNHSGFSLAGIIRAVKKNLETDVYLQGGSTITQQLVKNALLSSERTYVRKLKELVLAIEVELIFSKDEILQMYFNEIPYGGVAYGVAEAAETYFGKSVQELNLAESALLAGIPTAPTRYSPLGAHPEYAIYRQHHVLNRMVEDGYITPEESLEAKRTKLVLKPHHAEILAPHFVMYVKDLLVEKYGTRMLEEGGLEVITSLDPKVQTSAENAVKAEIEKLLPMHVTNGAALVTHPYTGEILAMVGSRNYFDTNSDGNVNVTTSLRQPGSSIKPLTYALALQSGFTPASMIDDAPVSYPDGNRAYTPVNYDGRFHGRVTLRTALGSSFNIPAVKLLNQLGVDNLIDFAETMGITTWKDRSRFGLSLTLGGGEVKMTDMAVVYGVFANQGLKVNLHPILQVKGPDGRILDDFYCNPGFHFLPSAAASSKNVFCQPQAVLSPSIAYQISDMLSDNNARTPAFGPNSLLKIDNHQVAVKTGTTNDRRDNWTIGYTPEYVVVVWVGNNDNTPMSSVASGITGATPIWHSIITDLLTNTSEPVTFQPPSGLIPVQICEDNGLLACSTCRNIKTEYFIPGTQPKQSCQQETLERISEQQTQI